MSRQTHARTYHRRMASSWAEVRFVSFLVSPLPVPPDYQLQIPLTNGELRTTQHKHIHTHAPLDCKRYDLAAGVRLPG